MARANANCRYLLRQTKQLGKGVLVGPLSAVRKRINERVIGPGIALLERVATRQQVLQPAFHDPRFDLYANLFDPIIVLAQQRLQSGRDGNLSQSKKLEGLLASLGSEQQNAARAAGLPACDQDFEQELVSSFSA